MKPVPDPFHRSVTKTLVSVAVILLSQIFLLSPVAAQAPRPLQLTAEVIEQRYCSINRDKITLQVKLRVRYSNLGAERLIIYQGHDLFYQIKVRSDAGSETLPYEVLLLNMHYFDEEFERIDASSPGKVFEKLAPKEVFERERSEEHTSELQSQSNLVCRLLLEKKNQRLSVGPIISHRRIGINDTQD